MLQNPSLVLILVRNGILIRLASLSSATEAELKALAWGIEWLQLTHEAWLSGLSDAQFVVNEINSYVDPCGWDTR
ncbi:hypothetical protein FNV43_RR19444 [Rhamnella rubrinervis]|uniref:RNase H type-1 domain-containing protein n=1 Tax=Rhamnella rubrinervis TaxID=2594499 RepID=A0A8K0DSN9_9ROSA|nr:hypothetical protein FNV43_RR19444 [Rhamnella rubrinervis]